MELPVEPIGVIKSPFKTLANMPVQPKGAAGTEGEVLVAYIDVFDRVAESRSGWFTAGEHEVAKKRSDSRFA